MKLSKLRAAAATRKLAGASIPRQGTSSSSPMFRAALSAARGAPDAGESGSVDGSPARARLDRARRHGGRVNREVGGRAGEGDVEVRQSATDRAAEARSRASKADDRAQGKAALGVLLTGGGIGTGAGARGKIAKGLGALATIGGVKSMVDAGPDLDEKKRQDATAKDADWSAAGYERKSGGPVKGFIRHKGALRKALGTKDGETIPAKKFDQAAHSDNPTLKKRAVLAKTMRGWRKGG